MSTRPAPSQTRRERRAAERARGDRPNRRSRTSGVRRGSPILQITLLVGIVAVGLVGTLVVLQGSAPRTVDAAELEHPATATPLELAADRSLGRADAPVTLDVWSDFQCPACGQFARTVVPTLIREYVTPGTLRIVYHDAAFQGKRAGRPYDESIEAAAGARCAAINGMYWPFHDWLFANQSGENNGAFADERLRSIALSAGLDLATWDACRATGEQQAAVRTETGQAATIGVNATPTMSLNGETLVGLRAVSELRTKIEAAAVAATGG